MRSSEDQLRSLMVAGLEGDAAAHSALLRTLVPMLRSFYRRRMGDSGDVEDLVQETLIAVHTRRESYDRERRFTPWLYSVARFKMIDHFRRHRPTVPIADVEAMLGTESFEDASNAGIDIERLLDTLPAKQAGALRHTRLEGYSTAEAARAANIGESDVKVSVHRGLKALAARLKGASR